MGVRQRSSVGAGLPAMGPCQPPSLLMTHRYRGQARLPQLILSEHKIGVLPRSTVGAGLPAMGPCQSPSLLNDPPPSRASPAPTEIFSEYKNWRSAEIQCGSGLARD